jgi:isopentenyl phosphate kinase
MYLNKFSTTISTNGDDYVVNYHGDNTYGHCIYKKLDLTGSNKPIRQSVMLLTHCQMGEIIEEINKETPLKDMNSSDLSNEIRDHSLSTLTEWLSSQKEGNG